VLMCHSQRPTVLPFGLPVINKFLML